MACKIIEFSGQVETEIGGGCIFSVHKPSGMKWQGRESSDNVDDRRKGTTAKKVGAGLGIGSILIVIIGLLLGQDPAQLLSQFQGSGGSASEASGVQQAGSADDELAAFVGVVLKDTEDVMKEAPAARNGLL